MLILAALSLWVLLGSLAIWARAAPRGASILLGATVIGTAQVVGLLLLLGWLGHLRREVVIGVSVLLNAVLIGSRWQELNQVLRHLLADTLAALHDLARTKRAAAILVVVAGMWIGVLALGLLLPPTDFDGLAQHIPIAAFHLQSGNLARIDTPYRGINAYPANGSLLIAWSILGAGSEVAVDLVQWPFWLLGALAVYHLARRVGALRADAALGSAIFMSAPVVILQARAAYVDLMLAALTLTALALIVDRPLPSRLTMAVVGCALGLVAGLKYAGAIFAALQVGLLAVWVYRRRVGSRLALALDGGAVALPLAGLGGYWYLANWRDLGNPFWPIGVQVGRLVIFQGIWTTETFYQEAVPAALQALAYPLQLWTVWRELSPNYGPDMRLGGLGPLWLSIGLPCLALYMGQTFLKRQRVDMAIVVYALCAFVLTPLSWHTRYVIAPVALSGVAVAKVLGHLDRWPGAILSAIIIGFSLYSFGLAIDRGPIAVADVERFLRLPAMERRTVFLDNVPGVRPAMRWFDRNVPDNVAVAYGWEGVMLYPFWEQAAGRTMNYVPPADPPAWYDVLNQRAVQYLIVRQGSVEAEAATRDSRFRSVFWDPADYAIYDLRP